MVVLYGGGASGSFPKPYSFIIFDKAMETLCISNLNRTYQFHFRFISHLYFPNEIKFNLKIIKQESLLFCKPLNKQSFQYFIT